MKNRCQDDLLCIHLNPQDSGGTTWRYGKASGPGGQAGSPVMGQGLAPLFSLAWLMEKSEKMNFK